MKTYKLLIFISLVASHPIYSQKSQNLRARDLGIPFDGRTGQFNAITDVPGVEVGYQTKITGSGKLIVGQGPVRTGVTVVLPKGKLDKEYPIGYFIFNGNGEVTGLPYIYDFGKSKGPIGITNTYSVGVTRDAIGEWCFKNFSLTDHHDFRFGLPIVGETFDGGLNDINGFHIKKEDVFKAIESAKTGLIEEGNVGGGTGMVCYSFKGGTGTASRIITIGGKEYTVGIIVQANFGYRRHLSIRGIPIGKLLSDTLLPSVNQDGSIIAIVGTDAPLTPLQLNMVAKRVTLGVARTGTIGSTGSGDIFLAFSTHEPTITNGVVELKALDDRPLNRVFNATVEATEEAIINALIAAEDMEGINGNTFYSIPHRKVKQIFKNYSDFLEKVK
ncbi:DmpA family aminopeptidase [Perlabentimonas gracilis]|uniref:DmpA family aminopeptidase n=1 Tax=Perlabentimonas gracilis TaxID=2715279 RepID=UPI0014072987|nr:P1 family peptidase [Perlabentimonas gracilis]NHB68716.1 P1 family peptidase [Perlabentimonas gracilis]